MLPDNRALVNHLPTLLDTPYYPNFALLYTFCCQQHPILSPFHLLALVVICKKHCISSISLVVQVFKISCLLNITLKTVQKTWLLAFGFPCF